MKNVILFLVLVLSPNYIFAQLSIPNIDFKVETNPRRTLFGEVNSVTFRYELKNTMTGSMLINLINEKLSQPAYNWLEFDFLNDYEITFRVKENNTGVTRRFIFLSTFNQSVVVITQMAQASGVNVFNVSGGGNTIPRMVQNIYLDGSDVNLVYKLYAGDTKIATKVGTGGKLVFTGEFVGNYFIRVERDGLEKRMNGGASFNYFPIINNNISLLDKTLAISSDGDVISTPFVFLFDEESGWNDLREIVKACNDGRVNGWNKEHVLYLSTDINKKKGCIHVIGSPNISQLNRESRVYLGPHDEFLVTQQPGGSVKIFNVYGNGNLILGQKTSILLAGSQHMNYGLYRNSFKVNELMGTGKTLKFSGLTEPGEYTIKAECEGQVIPMNGTIHVRDINVHPPCVTEEVRTGSEHIIRSTTYYDGQGRSVQQVGVGASPGGKDIITPVTRDGAGRETTTYLPYVMDGNGGFRVNAVTEQETFYSNLYGTNPVAYTSSRFDDSPYDRVIEQGGLGFSWRLGGGHTTLFSYRKNVANDSVKRYVLVGTSVQLDSTFWPINSLSVQVVTNPEGDMAVEYRDIEGNIVARETRLTTGKRMFSYEVRDMLGRLRYVIPPIQDSLFTSGTKSLTELLRYCYYTEYDDRGRAYKQYKPGAGFVINLYDNRGRLVLTQDAEQRKRGKWSFTKYDELNRPVISGFCTGTETEHRAALASQTIFGETRGTALHGYTNGIYPTAVTANDCYLITYYDNYDWSGQSAVVYSSVDAVGDAKNDNVIGQITGTKTKVLGIVSHQWLLSATYFDKKYRSVQSVSQLYPSGLEIVSNAYDFTGQVTRAKVKQTVGALVTEYNKYFTYDQQGRLVKIDQQITGDNVNGRVTIIENVYDELGRLSAKKLHNGREIQSYQYNVGGNVTSVSSSAFSYTLGYDQVGVTGATARYDGNINAMTWKNGGGMEKAYIYSYDPLGQLREAIYKEKSGTNWTANSTGKYNMYGLAYDLNGNIKSLYRNGATGTTLHALDYTYGTTGNGNAVSKITLNGGALGTYAYNENGNMITDGRRGHSITYNELNLPAEISHGQNKISYIYSADGEKLAQQVAGSSSTYYRGVMIYNGDMLDCIFHPSGVTRKVNNGYVYDYFLADHLGSTRVVLEASTSALTPIQTTEYYPFGLAFTYNNLNKNKQLFSGKELQDAELAKEIVGWYDFGSRFYDPVVARWFCQDPASQLTSPYVYCGNNPVAFVDPDGESFLAAFFIGAMANVVLKGFMGNDSGNFWKDYLIGGIAGVAGLGAGMGVGNLISSSSSIGGGFVGGSISGATGGFAGGFVGGVGNSWLYGGNFGQGLKNGMMDGSIGIVTGGLAGGIGRGFSDYRRGYSFWNGVGETTEFSLGQSALKGNEALIAKEYARGRQAIWDTDYLQNRIKDEFNIGEGDWGIKEITTKSGRGYGMDRYGNMYNLKTRSKVGGYARGTSNGSFIHISPMTTNSNTVDFRAISGHELNHAYHFYRFGALANKIYSERVAYEYSFNVYLKSGNLSSAYRIMNTALRNNFWGYYPNRYKIPAYFTFY